MAWVTLILLTHRGAHSPYTYAGPASYQGKPVDRAVNPDAPTVVPVTRFFYDGTIPDWTAAHNIRLPLHSFFASIVTSFFRSYLAANDVLNWLFMLLLTIAALRFEPKAPLVALATIYALPAFVSVIGQPMHYVTGTVINFLIILAAIAMPPEELREAHVAGLMTAILTLNYDWYVFGAALAVYLLCVIRFERLRDALLYVVISLAPITLWKLFIDFVSQGDASYSVRSKFFGSVVAGWMTWIHHWRELPLLPFTATHIGAQMALHEVLAQIWWPLLVCCVIALWILRPPLTRVTGLLLLLVIFFGLEQLFTAAFDPENSPRRALPVVCAFAFAWCWIVDRWERRRPGGWSGAVPAPTGRRDAARPAGETPAFRSAWWTVTFLTLFALTAFLAFADTLLHSAAIPGLYMGEAIRSEPKWALEFQANRVAIGDVPPGPQFSRAAIGNLNAIAIASQLYIAFFAAAFFWILAKAQLLPRYAPLAFLGMWLLSGVRFLF